MRALRQVRVWWFVQPIPRKIKILALAGLFLFACGLAMVLGAVMHR